MENKGVNKFLISKYPYLLPRRFYDDEQINGYDYEYLVADFAIPQGWRLLFLMMCDDIRKPLEDCGDLNNFKFSDIKEKWGYMSVSTNYGAKEVLDIIDAYERISVFVCSHCGEMSNHFCAGLPLCSYCCDCEDYNKKIKLKLETDQEVAIFNKYFKKGDIRTNGL